MPSAGGHGGGMPPVGLREEIKIAKYMGSLNKVKDAKVLQIWMPKHPGEKVLSDKIDGVSAGTDGKLLWTRGDGVTGVLITHLKPYLNIPVMPSGTLVRGEIVMFKETFDLRYKDDKVNPRNTASGIVNSKSPTIQEASDLRFIAYEFVEDSKDMNRMLPQSEQFERLKNLGFTVPYYEVMGGLAAPLPPRGEEAGKGADKDVGKSKKVTTGKKVVKGKRKNEESDDDEKDVNSEDDGDDLDNLDGKQGDMGAVRPHLDIGYLSSLIARRKKEAAYEMDGIVIAENVPVKLVDGQNPKHMIAYKAEDEVILSTVLRVEWNISKHGTLRPLVHIEPVKVSGVTISKASGHNARIIIDSKIGPGAVVEIVRSGQVIPKIQSVITPATKLDMPTCEYEWAKIRRTCLASPLVGVEGSKASKLEEEEKKKLGATLEPVHGKERYWVWYEASDVHFAPKNLIENKEVQIKKIINFFKKMEAKHVGAATINKIFECGYDTLGKIFDAKVDDLVDVIEGMKKKSGERFVDAVRGSITNTNLAKVAAAAGIFGDNVGEKKLEKIFDACPDILDSKMNQTELIQFIQGVGGIKTLAPQIASNLKNLKTWLAEHPQITFASPDGGKAGGTKAGGGDADSDSDEDPSPEERKVKKKKVDKEQDKGHDDAKEKKAEKPAPNKPLKGKSICFSGFRNPALKLAVTRLGGKVTDSIAKKTSYLVTGKKPGPSKMSKAEEYEIEVVDVEKFKLLFSIP